MADPELLQQRRDELPAEYADLASDLPQPTPAEWVQQARGLESEAEKYPDERIEIWSEAAEAWFQAGEPEAAERCYRQIAEEPHRPGFPDPRVYYASFLLEHRDVARGEELFAEIWRGRPTEPGTYHYLAETLEALEEYQRALTWTNAGLSRCYPQPFSPEVDDLLSDQDLDMLLTTRLRVRQELQQPEDWLDELSAQARAAFRELLDSTAADEPELAPPTVLYWPSAEFEQVLQRWPGREGGTDSGTDPHTEHRRIVERSLRASAEGRTPLVVHADAAGFADFCAEEGLDPAKSSSDADYATWLAELGHGSVWPAGRNDACWCGSQRKYKKCCGAPGFAE